MASAPTDRVRWRLLVNVVHALEPLMAMLGIVWLLLLVIEFTGHAAPAVAYASNTIWIVFIIDFLAEFIIAPKKGLYLRRHWLILVSLVIPALRFARAVHVVRLARIMRSMRGMRLAQTLTSMNRAMASLRATMRRRGFSYVSALTLLVTVGGAGAMYAFENGVPDPAGIHDFGTALWWTAMIMTTMGSAYWPETPEGRVLCVLLALYAFAVFGYVTATLATFFVSRDAERPDAPVAGQASVDALREEVARLADVVAGAVPPQRK